MDQLVTGEKARRLAARLVELSKTMFAEWWDPDRVLEDLIHFPAECCEQDRQFIYKHALHHRMCDHFHLYGTDVGDEVMRILGEEFDD